MEDFIDVVPEKWDDEKPEEVKESKPNLLFSITGALFKDREYIYSLTRESCNQSLFMVLRRLAINYPLQANLFNIGKCNAMDTIRFWGDHLYNGKYIPKWMMTSGKKDEAAKKRKGELTKEEIRNYKEYYGINDKDFNDAMRFFPDDTIKEVQELNQYLKQKAS
jgi:hypothetical protein